MLSNRARVKCASLRNHSIPSSPILRRSPHHLRNRAGRGRRIERNQPPAPVGSAAFESVRSHRGAKRPAAPTGPRSRAEIAGGSLGDRRTPPSNLPPTSVLSSRRRALPSLRRGVEGERRVLVEPPGRGDPRPIPRHLQHRVGQRHRIEQHQGPPRRRHPQVGPVPRVGGRGRRR